MSQAVRSFSKGEVAKHAFVGDLWVVIDLVVYDLSKFAPMHPGGISILLNEEVAGQDATQAFFGLHRQEVLNKLQYQKLRIGVIEGAPANAFPTVAPSDALDKVPYAEPAWLTEGYHSPYFSEGHRRFQKVVRKFVKEVVYPDAQKKEEDGKPPSKEVLQALADTNIIAMRLGSGRHLEGRVLLEGAVRPEEFDIFHEMILWEEFSHIHARGYSDGLAAGVCIGLPPVLNFGNEKLKDAIIEDILSGKKLICLAVSEAFAGSDVAGMKCSAKRTEGGWIVNGTSQGTKWITNGMQADYFTTACRNQSNGSIMLMVVERGQGMSTKLIRTSYSTSAGTAFVTFDNMFVPDDFVISETEGLKIVLSNFNHERWVLTTASIGIYHRWVNQRRVFGKPLSSQAVVRSKLAAIISRVESCQNWLENVTYQMKNMNYVQQATEIAGQMALLKMYTTRASQDTARDAVQIFGGRGITKTGMGKHIEHFHRSLLIDAVGGGAEDIMADLGVRQALRKMPKNARL
ncbi:acyl-CoA dehydrogenase/oxidase [Crepidotus variabilis]|uniref:Acyl-CoA dehydrogenase/oxidase n=1 Tax=Crepidotus variabilis TaxID=179855 RepID=A0A9P6JMH3_9AGAR|nr:acyl-CoA dehydrogenase/oxidase [Crepidotus variabilis]